MNAHGLEMTKADIKPWDFPDMPEAMSPANQKRYYAMAWSDPAWVAARDAMHALGNGDRESYWIWIATPQYREFSRAIRDVMGRLSDALRSEGAV